MNQWISSVENGCGEGVIAQILTGVNKMNEHAQFYVMNVLLMLRNVIFPIIKILVL